MKTNKWQSCQQSMPQMGKPVVIEFMHSGLRTVAYLDITQTENIFLWVDEAAGTFHGTPDVRRWKEWDGKRP